ncbi:MAG: hypothetical protein ACI4WW_02640 [Candidatus Coprovivens sp.]
MRKMRIMITMIDLRVISTKEKKKLDKMFNILGISVEDLINAKNLKEEFENCKQELNVTKQELKILKEKSNDYDTTIKTLIQNVNDIMTGRYDERLNQMLAEVGGID